MYANISDTNDTHTKKVDDLIKNKKYFILICKIDDGIKTMQEKIVDKQRAENPINEIIYNLFSTDYFFPILFLWMQAYNSHHVLHKLWKQQYYYFYQLSLQRLFLVLL